MADYAARISELDKEVATLREAALTVERGGGPAVVLATYVRLVAGLEAYGSMRDRAFHEGLALLKAESGATAESQQRRWSEHFTAKGSEAFKQLNDLASRDEDALKRPFELFAMQESSGFAAVASMPVAGAVGQLCEHLRTLDEQTRILQSKWKDLAGLDERADGQIAALRVQVLEAFKRGVSDARGWAPKIEEAVRKVVDLWDRKEETDPEPSVAPAVKAFLDALGLLQRTLDDAAQQSQPLYASEQPIHEMFGNVRLQVKDYLEKVNKDSMAKMYSDACRGALEAANKSPKEGQRTDAKQLAEKAIAASQSVMADFNSAWDKFYQEFQGKFTGDVSDETVEFLADQEFFNRFWKDVEALNLPGEIQSVGNSLARLENLSLDRVTPEQRTMFDVEIRARLKEIQDKIRSMDSSVWERFKVMFVTTPLSLAVERLKKLPGYRK